MARKQEAYSVAEVSALIQEPYHRVIRMLKKGEEFPNAYKVGWGWVIPVSDVTPVPVAKKKRKTR